MSARYVVLGLAPPRSEWCRRVGRWANVAALPAEFLRCVSVEELRIRLDGPRRYSVVIVDAATAGLDRDLVARAAETGCATIVVDDVRDRRDWSRIGVGAVLAPAFSRDELVEVLASTATMVGTAQVAVPEPPEIPDAPDGRLVAVTGPGGTGASVCAIALAEGLAAPDQPRSRIRTGTRRAEGPAPSVLLVDLCRAADQAMLHDSIVVVPGIQELVEAHRGGTPERSRIAAQTFDVPERGYRLVLGLRRPRHWALLRRLALEAALASLSGLAEFVVADVEPEVEGERETGSADVEDRNAAGRSVMSRAEAVMVVGEPSMKGLHALVRTIGELAEFGVPGERVLPVLNRSPRSTRARRQVTDALGELLAAQPLLAGQRVASPVCLPRRDVDAALRDSGPVPRPLPSELAAACRRVLGRVEPRGSAPPEAPEPIRAGSLGLATSTEVSR